MVNNEYIPFYLAHKLYPVCNADVAIFIGDKYEMVNVKYSHEDEWGQMPSIVIHGSSRQVFPKWIEAEWLSVAECGYYLLETEIDVKRATQLWHENTDKNDENNSCFRFLQFGLAPYGGVAVWLCGPQKAVLLQWLKGEAQEKAIIGGKETPITAFQPVCKQIFDLKEEAALHNKKNGVPSEELFEGWMRQFNYCYQPLFAHWNGCSWSDYDRSLDSDELEPEIDYIEDSCYDGSYDHMRNGKLLGIHQGGMPKRIALCWHEGDNSYKAFFWMEDQATTETFRRFFRFEPDLKTDFQIRIDSNQKKYELTLCGRDTVQPPLLITEQSYQFLVFRNDFEYCRSANFEQEDDAWAW